MEYMGEARSNEVRSRLFGFNFSTTTGFILELCPEGLNVWGDTYNPDGSWKATEMMVLDRQVDLPYSESECFEVQAFQVNDVVYLSHSNHRPRRLVRYSDTRWKLEEVEWKYPPMGDENVTATTLEIPAERTSEQGFLVDYYHLPEGETVTPEELLERGISQSQIPTSHLWYPTDTGGFPRPDDEEVPFGMIIKGVLEIETPGLYHIRMGVDGKSQLKIDDALLIDDTEDNADQSLATPIDLTAGRHAFELRVVGGAVDDGIEVRLTPPGEVEVRLTEPNGNGWTFFQTDPDQGTIATMKSSKSLFKEGHIGSFWEVAHRREDSFTEIDKAAATGDFAEIFSEPLTVVGKWDLYTYGDWTATLYIERRTPSGSWEVLRSWQVKGERNIISSGAVDVESDLRLRLSAGSIDKSSAHTRFLLEAADSKIRGLVEVKGFTSATEVKVKVLNPVQSAEPTAYWTEGAFSDLRGFPRAVGAHGGRTWYAGTREENQRLWGSVTNDFDNFRRSSYDDGSISFAPAAQERNRAQWIASQGQVLLLGTAGEEWMIHGEGRPITPTNIKVERQSRFGSAYLPARMVDESIVFTQRGSRKIRRIGSRSEADSWSAPDLTVLAEHVTDSGVVQTAFASNPHSILWCVTNDGRLLGMTYEQEQNVFGWHVHDTDGHVESVAVNYGTVADEVWLAVRRIDGKGDYVRMIERLDPAVFARDFKRRERLIYLDAAKRYESDEPFNEVTGLHHLEGLAVSILADGAERGQQAVKGGRIWLEPAASTAVIGLPYVSELQPSRVEIPMQDGTSHHRVWRTSRVGVYLHDSLGGEVADSPEGKWAKFQFREASTPRDSPPELFTGEKEEIIESEAGANVDVVIRQSAPLPLNVGSITLKGDVFGE